MTREEHSSHRWPSASGVFVYLVIGCFLSNFIEDWSRKHCETPASEAEQISTVFLWAPAIVAGIFYVPFGYHERLCTK